PLQKSSLFACFALRYQQIVCMGCHHQAQTILIHHFFVCIQEQKKSI
ncbi:uncharacterized protein METZ01_LOCUS223734, partial [marine metagenome]